MDQKDRKQTRYDFEGQAAPPLSTSPKRPIVEIDLERYLPIFDDPDVPVASKLELFASLRSIVRDFVKLGFGVHPLQQTCGKDIESDAVLSGPLLDGVYWEDQPPIKTEAKPDAQIKPVEEGVD